MIENRLYQRVACDGNGVLQLPDRAVDVKLINLSQNGACLEVKSGDWKLLEGLESTTGTLDVVGRHLSFGGSLCWSAAEDKRVRFGVQFAEVNQVKLEEILEQISLEISAEREFNLNF